MELADAKSGRVVETITGTRRHPFYVKGKGFVPAGALAIGNSIVTRAGPPLVVKSVTWKRRTEGYNVYNFVVEDDHSYFVGKANGGAWVHNPRYYWPEGYKTKGITHSEAYGAEDAFRQELEGQGITLTPKSGGNTGGPDAIVSAERAKKPDWIFAELNPDNRNGRLQGGTQVRDRLNNQGYQGPGALYGYAIDPEGGYHFRPVGQWPKPVK